MGNIGRRRVYGELVPSTLALLVHQHKFVREQAFKANMFVAEYLRELVSKEMKRVEGMTYPASIVKTEVPDVQKSY